MMTTENQNIVNSTTSAPEPMQRVEIRKSCIVNGIGLTEKDIVEVSARDCHTLVSQGMAVIAPESVKENSSETIVSAAAGEKAGLLKMKVKK